MIELVGTLHRGWRESSDALKTEVVVTTAGLVVAGELSIKLAVAYANDRKVFGGKAILRYRGLQFPVAPCHAEIELARLLNHKAASHVNAGLPYSSESHAAKLLAAQPAVVTTENRGMSPAQHVAKMLKCVFTTQLSVLGTA